ncbi:MAG: polymer-forming cytoskeletal protein [Rhodospirillales bacterium]|nr:MAG: polymer-forming cytoskeletal protein [Rhodospirillales bacterium]
MFRRKKPEENMTVFDPDSQENSTENVQADGGEDGMSAPPMKPFSRKGTHMPNKPPAAPFRPDIPRRVVDIPGSQRRPMSPGQETDGKKLIVGRDICLTGEISACDRLVVEGRVEASLSDARSVDISETGFFKGNAEVEEATIAGCFEGKLIVNGRLCVRANGRVRGTVRYASLVVEQGGQLSGSVELVETVAPAASSAPPLLGLAAGTGSEGGR